MPDNERAAGRADADVDAGLDAPAQTRLGGSTLPARSVLFLVLRRLRTPMLVLVLVYAVSIYGLTLIPGLGPDGQPGPPMSFFHALYFVSYTATTIGFGEMPGAFSDAQRMWVLVIIHLTVIGWTYSILYALSLLQDQVFQRAIAQIRFSSRVRRMREPFDLICGAGDTGQRMARLLDRLDLKFVMVEASADRVTELELEDFRSDLPILQADPARVSNLLTAGLQHPMCRSVLALTADDRTNLAVATAARLLARHLTVIAGAHSPRTVASMRAHGTQHIINPFDAFAENLLLALRAPGCYRLLDWLTAPPDTKLDKEYQPPRGTWIVCGYGRFGQAVARRLLAQGLQVTAIDPQLEDAPAEPAEGRPARLRGFGTDEQMLLGAGIAEAGGLVIGTDDDVTNLAIGALARRQQAKLSIVMRQNDVASRPLMANFRADLVMRPSEIIADECVALLTTPLLERFLETVRKQDDAWGDEVIHQLRKRIGVRSPNAWSVRIDPAQAPAVCERLASDAHGPQLADLLRDPADRQQPIEAFPLMILRQGRESLLPNADSELVEGDEILFAGRSAARRQLTVALSDSNALRYLCTGRDLPGGWLFTRRRAAQERS